MATNGVVNLSDRVLTLDEITLLQRGLKFCPTPSCPDPGQIREYLNALHRRMRVMTQYDKNPQESLNRPKANKSLTTETSTMRHSHLSFKDSKVKRKSS